MNSLGITLCLQFNNYRFTNVLGAWTTSRTNVSSLQYINYHATKFGRHRFHSLQHIDVHTNGHTEISWMMTLNKNIDTFFYIITWIIVKIKAVVYFQFPIFSHIIAVFKPININVWQMYWSQQETELSWAEPSAEYITSILAIAFIKHNSKLCNKQ